MYFGVMYVGKYLIPTHLTVILYIRWGLERDR
jgi:hypothetical protein